MLKKIHNIHEQNANKLANISNERQTKIKIKKIEKQTSENKTQTLFEIMRQKKC